MRPNKQNVWSEPSKTRFGMASEQEVPKSFMFLQALSIVVIFMGLQSEYERRVSQPVSNRRP